MLLQICEFIRKEKIASNQQLERIFRIDLDALQAILDLCLRKGLLVRYYESSTGACKKKCFKCQSPSTMYYCIASIGVPC